MKRIGLAFLALAPVCFGVQPAHAQTSKSLIQIGKAALESAGSGAEVGKAVELLGGETTALVTRVDATELLKPPRIKPVTESVLKDCAVAEGTQLSILSEVVRTGRLAAVEPQLAEMKRLLDEIYSDPADAQIAFEGIEKAIADFDEAARSRMTAGTGARERPFSHEDVYLITYADMIEPAEGKSALATLDEVVSESLPNVNTVHLLPFYPATGDGGFAVADYSAVDPALGTWNDIARMRQSKRLMFDTVFNHTSSKHEWFLRDLAGEPEYADFYLRVDPKDPGLGPVFRPRTTPVAHEFEGQSVWTTFSADQVDLNLRNPRVMVALTEELLGYAEKGADVVRLDAVTFLFKKLGTDSIHLPETHKTVQLWRQVLDAVAPDMAIITETNVPHTANVSYFGEGVREADMVYNFPLPPLTAHTFISGDTTALKSFLERAGELPEDKVLFNFLASHDGVGVGGAREFLTEEQINAMAEVARDKGGLVGEMEKDGVRRVYEMNITWPSLITDESASMIDNASKLMATYSIQMSLKGVPAIYFPSFVSEMNWTEGAERLTRRDINRRRFELEEIEQVFAAGKADVSIAADAPVMTQVADGLRAELGREPTLAQTVYYELNRRLGIRNAQPAFSPYASQSLLETGNDGVLGIVRCSECEQPVAVLTNVTGEPKTVTVNLSEMRPSERTLTDLLTNRSFEVTPGGELSVTLDAYQSLWLRR